jgi:serine/threonine protein phosphatase PrpC
MSEDFEHFVRRYQDELGKAHIALTLQEARVKSKPIYEQLQKDQNFVLLRSMMTKLKQLALNAEHASQRFMALLQEANKLTTNDVPKENLAALKEKQHDQIKQKSVYIDQQTKTKQMIVEFVEKAVQEHIQQLKSSSSSLNKTATLLKKFPASEYTIKPTGEDEYFVISTCGLACDNSGAYYNSKGVLLRSNPAPQIRANATSIVDDSKESKKSETKKLVPKPISAIKPVEKKSSLSTSISKPAATTTATSKKEGILTSSATSQNRRDHQEDRFVIDKQVTFSEREKGRYVFCAVFDGHAGKAAAEFLTTRYVGKMQEIALYAATVEEIHPDRHAEMFLPTVLQQAMSDLVEEWDTQQEDPSGSTATMLLIDRKTGFASFLNLGDSRSVLYDSTNGEVMYSTKDHELENEEEAKSVTARTNSFTGEACTISRSPRDVARVCGILAMPRAFGDNGEQTVGCVGREPDCYTFNIRAKPTIAVLASDGLWDDFTKIQVGKMVAKEHFSATEILARVLNKPKGSGDNCTIVVVEICPK